MSQKKFTFGYFYYPPPSKELFLKTVRRAEDLGFEKLFLGDHALLNMSPLPALLAAANATKILRVGTSLLGNDFYNPLWLAREVATLDMLTDGRFDFGIGTGWFSWDYQAYGIALDPPMTRIRRLGEAVKIFKQFFNEEKVEFSGKFYQVKADNPQPKTIQRPFPITMGGGGKNMLSLAAREADTISINILTTPQGWVDSTTITREKTEQKIDWIRQAAGERLGKIYLSIHFQVIKILDSQSQVEDFAAKNISESPLTEALSTSEYLASPHLLVGSENFLIEKILELRETLGISDLVFWEPMEDGARLVHKLNGM